MCEFALPQSDGIHVHFLCVRTGLIIEQRYALRKKEAHGAVDKVGYTDDDQFFLVAYKNGASGCFAVQTIEMYSEYIDYFFDKKLAGCIGPRDFWCQLDQKRPWESSPSVQLPAWPAAVYLHVW